jgi:hypothetical protein
MLGEKEVSGVGNQLKNFDLKEKEKECSLNI